MRALQHEVALGKTTSATMQRRAELSLEEKEETIQRLTLKLKKYDGTINTNDAGKRELRDQLNVLTERVLTQQATIEKLTSQRVMLQQSNVELKELHHSLKQAALMSGDVGRRNYREEDEDGFDLENGDHYGHGGGLLQRRSGGSGGSGSRGDALGLRNSRNDATGRRASSMTSIRQLRPLLEKNQTIRSALRSVDQFLFLGMSVIRKFPTARLAFLMYMLMLHAWSMFLVSHHSSCITSGVDSVSGGGSHNHHIPGAMPNIPGPPIHIISTSK